MLKQKTEFFVSGHCPLILPYHVALDHAREVALGDKKIGTTGRGIGPAYEDKVARRAVHVSDLLDPELFAEKVRRNCKLINFLLANYYNSEPVDVGKDDRRYAGNGSENCSEDSRHFSHSQH